MIGRVQRDLAAHQAAADDDHGFSQLLGMVDGVQRGHGLLQAGNGRHGGRGADSQDHGVRRLLLHAVDAGLMVQLDIDAQPVQFSFIPGIQPSDFLLEIVGAGLHDVAAQVVALLKQRHGVAAQRRGARRLHARHAAADDDDLLAALAGLQAHHQFPGGLGVHGAGDGLAGLHAAAEAAHVAADAGADVLDPAGHDLVGIVRVGQGGASQAHGVDLAGLDGRGC